MKQISGEGLPNPFNNRQIGDLYVHFNIKFPIYISKELRSRVGNVLDEIEKSLETEQDSRQIKC